MFIGLPASVGLIMISRPLVAVLYERGAFDSSSTQRVADVLAVYSAGMVAYFLQHVLARAMYALQDSKTPARIALWMVGVNLALNLALVGPLKERGLALGTALTALLQMLVLLGRLRPRITEEEWRAAGLAAIRIVLATGIMAFVLVVVAIVCSQVTLLRGHQALLLVVLLLVGVASYGIAAMGLGIPELRTVFHRTRSERVSE